MRLIFKNLFKKRRADVSLVFFTKMLFILCIQKFLNFFNFTKLSHNRCTIIFPPSLGLGDLISLSRIIEIVKSTNQFKEIYILHFCPYVQKKIPGVIYIRNLENKIYINSNIFILPTPSRLNKVIGFILGINKCKGYFFKNKTNFNTKSDYQINEYDEPYYYRLIPFLDYFKSNNKIKPYIWNHNDIKEFNKKDSIFSLLNIKNIKKDSKLIVLNTYNFYEKFRPNKNAILNAINKLYISKNKIIVILGGFEEKEIIYNKTIEKFIKQNIKDINILNYTSLLSLKNSIKIISESDFYIGANNGLGNISQMLGKESIVLFTKHEKIIKRRFSESSSFIITECI